MNIYYKLGLNSPLTMGVIWIRFNINNIIHYQRLLYCLLNKCIEFIVGNYTNFEDETSSIAENAMDNLMEDEVAHENYDPVQGALEQENDSVYA